jgi:DNA-binding response OmpR family regulator
MNMHAHHLTRHQVIALLEERDTLREQVRQLEELLRPTIILPAAWQLTRREADCLNVLRAAAPRIVGRDYMLTALYGLSDEPPETNAICVFLSAVRRKLRDAGVAVHVETVRGSGWRLSPQSVAAFDEAVAAYRDSFDLTFDRRAA